ncbi:unnamed protein product, partial [Linum tenue]
NIPSTLRSSPAVANDYTRKELRSPSLYCCRIIWRSHGHSLAISSSRGTKKASLTTVIRMNASYPTPVYVYWYRKNQFIHLVLVNF